MRANRKRDRCFRIITGTKPPVVEKFDPNSDGSGGPIDGGIDKCDSTNQLLAGQRLDGGLNRLTKSNSRCIFREEF